MSFYGTVILLQIQSYNDQYSDAPGFEAALEDYAKKMDEAIPVAFEKINISADPIIRLKSKVKYKWWEDVDGKAKGYFFEQFYVALKAIPPENVEYSLQNLEIRLLDSGKLFNGVRWRVMEEEELKTNA